MREQGRLPFTPPMRVEILGVNIQCSSLSKRKLEKSEYVLVESSKGKEKMQRLSREPIISEMLQMEWYVPFHFPTRISRFPV